MDRAQHKAHKKGAHRERGDAAAPEHSTRIERIASLLSELADLMREEGLGKEVKHHLHQLQMRVRFALPGFPSDSEDLPTSPPAKWLERSARDETPVVFIRREYGAWLGKGLTRAHIRQLDMSLYEALKHWLKKNELPADLDLPTKKEMIDRKLAALKPVTVDHSPAQREKLRLYQAARRRAAKDKP